MPVIDNETVKMLALPGLEHRTVAGHEQGVKSMEVWLQTLAPGASSPVHRHDCDEVIVILSGSGICTVAGEEMPFGANSTLVVEPDVVHQIRNTSDEPMTLVAALGMAPVRVRTADGTPLALPWDAPDP